MNLSDSILQSNNNLIQLLQHLGSEIKMSWVRDCDKTDAMKTTINLINKILEKDAPLEDFFGQNDSLLEYFMNNFLSEVITNILIQPVVYGENGDDIALELLYHIYKLFLKYHQNKKYSSLFARIRDIINVDKSNSHFFAPANEIRNQQTKIDNPKKRYNFYNFNHEFCSEFIDKTKEKENTLKVGDNIDLLIKYENSRSQIDKTAWIRGKIKAIDEESYNYIIESPVLESDTTIQINSNEILPEGQKTKDWEWRRNLKKYDVIDCYDRSKWFPATICNVTEEILKNGCKKITYKIGFRLYPQHFENKEDKDDKWDNYKCFWENKELQSDSNKEIFFGEKENYDEDIDFYSKRIQKFQSYTNVQKEYLNHNIHYSPYGNYNANNRNKIQKMNYELENETVKNTVNDDIFLYKKNGKINYIIGKTDKFSYYYALLLKKLADDNVFEEFIKILNDKPNSEEIYNIFYTLYNAIPYLHKQYLIDNLENFKNAIINFINNLDTKEIRNLPKELIDIIIKFLKRVSKALKLDEISDNDENKKDKISTVDEVTINFSIKMLKTSIFDRRIQGIKALNEYIRENNQKTNSMKIVIDLIQKNEIIKEIFGANYHSQIISKSDKILSLLLKNNELKEDDIKLIWDCTQRGDLEAKTTIMKLLSDLARNLNENYINILLENIIKTIDYNKINEKEIDFIYNLSIHGDNEKNVIKCCEYIYQCILKLDLNDNLQVNQIMEKLGAICDKDEKNLSKVLSMCEEDLKSNNSSLLILQILSYLLNKYTWSNTELMFLKTPIEDFTKNDNLLLLYKNNFNDYIKRIKELIKKNKSEGETASGNLENNDNLIIDNYSHMINIQKRIEFLNDWITLIYPSFDFVLYLKDILLDNPVSINDTSIFYEFMKKYISENKANESEAKKEKKNQIKNQLFKMFIENNQSLMTMSEFKLFMAIFLGINSLKIYYSIDNDDNYEIHVISDINEIQEMDKLWNVIFQLKDEKVLNKAISIIFSIYKNKNQIDKLLNKCNELIKKEDSTSEIIDKCFKLLRIIIIESEKNYIIKTKSHSNLIKNSIIYLPLKMTSKYSNIYYSSDNEENPNDNMTEIFFGNTTLNEIKELLIIKGKMPLKYIEVSLSKEYLSIFKEKDNKENKNEDSELLLDETYNNKSLMEILNNNYNQKLTPNKIFLFKHKIIERENLLVGNEFNPKFKEILKEWFKEFTEGTGKMDFNGCSRYIEKVTKSKESISMEDERIKEFFQVYDPDNLGYVTEEKFLEFYMKSLTEGKEQIVWENLKTMGVREDLHKNDEQDEIPYIDNNKLPRYCLGNDKLFIETLFNLFNKLENKKEIFDFLFFLSTNKEIYDNILNNINKSEENDFEKIFGEKNKILEQLYTLTIIESILEDINVNNIDYSNLFENCKKNDNKSETVIVMKSKNYVNFDDIDINKKNDFLKEFIKCKNFEKLLSYMDKLLIDYKFNGSENKEEDNLVLNICCEKSLKIINIIYNACYNNIMSKEKEKNDEKENTSNDNGIYLLDFNNLSIIVKEDNNIKECISQINFLEFATNLIKFINNINNYLNSNSSFSNNNNNLLRNSFNLLINLIAYNNKLLTELDSKEDIKKMLSSLIKNAVTCENEFYKSFYFKCLINSIKNLSNEKNDNKFLNLLFEITTNIFNEIISDQSINNNDGISSKSSILFFDFFSLLSSTKTDNEGNEILFKIYKLLFNNLKEIENEKKLSNDIFIGLMNILIKRIKNNENYKNIIINKEIEGKTLIEIIFEKIFEKNEKDNSEIINENINTEDNSKFINLDLIKQEKPQNNNEISKEIKNICNDYLIECFKSSKESKIIKKLSSIIKFLSEKKNNDENEEESQRKLYSSISTKKFGHVGLKNIGCICYMNSIMQQMYMVPTFRYAILGSDDHEPPKPCETVRLSIDDDNLLHQLQIMYTYLTYSEKGDYNPKYFCFSFKDFDGNSINPMIQQDSQEFYNTFCDKIENCLKKTKYKYIINDVFTGRTCSSVICESCKNVSNRFEDFYNLTLEVKNLSNLNDSLHKMTMPEKIEDFKCSKCNQKVTINKRTSLCDLPNVLVVQLKRFYMNYEIERTEKINSRFEFPFNINLKEFCIEDIVTQISGKSFESEDIYAKDDDYYNYELKGINIHMGSADGGHYFSLININRDGKGNILLDIENEDNKNTNNPNISNSNDKEKKYNWLKFNDSHISIFNINDIEKECFGGASKGSSYNFENFQNAYMLIYERKKKNPIRVLYENKNEAEEIIKDNKENIIKVNKDNRREIKKKYDINRKNNEIEESSLYNKLFVDEERDESYKYIPYYNIEKYAKRVIYNQVMQNNKKLEKMKNNSDNEDQKYNKDYYEILLNIICKDDFDILSEKYDSEIKRDLINIFLESIFTLVTNRYASEEEKTMVNSKTKIILEKIILPFVQPYLDINENNPVKSETAKNEENKSENNYSYLIMISSLLIQKEKLEKIYVNDLTSIFDNNNVELFSKIIKGIINVNYQKNTLQYFSIIDNLYNLIQIIDSTSTYPTIINTETNKAPLYYIYEILYLFILKDKLTCQKLINQSAISTLLRKLSNENSLSRNIIFNIVTYLIKNTDEYNDKLFNIEKDEKLCNNPFHEKNYLIKSIADSIVTLLFDERLELLIILIKILQYNELSFSREFNNENIYELFEYSIKNNKIDDMIKVLFGILEINDKVTFSRINSILGYPTMIIKQLENINLNDNKESFEEEKKEQEKDQKEFIKKEKKNYWPLFGERLLLEENNEDNNEQDKNNLNNKLKKHIFKYIGIIHPNENSCLLSLLFPVKTDKKESEISENIKIDEKERIKLIYDLLKLMLLGRGNYCLFKYIYLLPARSIYYKNLYEEMIDILEEDNKINNNLYNLEEIKKNANICIKKINYEINKAINELKNISINDEDKENKEYKLPEMMEKYYVNSPEVEHFFGVNPNMIQSDIVREEIQILTSGSNMYLMRLEYFTKYKTPDEIRNNLINKNTNEEEGIKPINEDIKQLEEKENEDEYENENEILKLDISECKQEIDGKQFMFDVTKKLARTNYSKIIYEDRSIKNLKKVKSSLIRFIIVNCHTSNNDMHIKVSQKEIPNEVKDNYYYPKFFVDNIKAMDITNFMNLNRIRSDLPFLKSNNIGINIDIKKPRNYDGVF